MSIRLDQLEDAARMAIQVHDGDAAEAAATCRRAAEWWRGRGDWIGRKKAADYERLAEYIEHHRSLERR